MINGWSSMLMLCQVLRQPRHGVRYQLQPLACQPTWPGECEAWPDRKADSSSNRAIYLSAQHLSTELELETQLTWYLHASHDVCCKTSFSVLILLPTDNICCPEFSLFSVKYSQERVLSTNVTILDLHPLVQVPWSNYKKMKTISFIRFDDNRRLQSKQPSFGSSGSHFSSIRR